MLIAARNGMVVKSSLLPPGARWVEYLESTGTQWIDTGIKPNGNTDFEICLQITTVRANLFGSRNVVTGRPAFGVLSHTSLTQWSIARLGDSWNTLVNANSSKNTFAFRNGIATFNGENVGTSSGDVQVDYTATIFAYNNKGEISSSSIGKLFYAKLWQNNALVRDFRPIAIGTTGYMLDLVSGDYLQYGNAGTGAFVIGPDK